MAWSEKVYAQLAATADVARDHFVWLAGMKYRKYLIDRLPNSEVPLQGLTIGRQLQHLQQQIAEMSKPMSTVCHQLHQLANRLPRHRFPLDMNAIPLNGIYILFEASEVAHGVDRIVRIGTHTGNDRLRSRLNEHFVKEKKDRSIFRKNIGRALLSRAHDPFLADWELDLTESEAKAQHAGRIDPRKLQAVERQVTQYIQEKLSFVVLRVDDKAERLALESKLISTVSTCQICGPSIHWLGRHSPKDKIRTSGLWLVNELYKTPLSPAELTEVEKLTRLSA